MENRHPPATTPPPIGQQPVPSQPAPSPYAAPATIPHYRQPLPGGQLGEYIPTPEERSSAMLVHLLGILTGAIGVLIMWLVKKDQSRFVDFHGREALNFMLSLLVYSICLTALALVVGLLTFMMGLFLMVPFYLLLGIGSLVLEILACTAANRGEWHRYPLCIRFIPNAPITHMPIS
ncbi:MAG: DUF4870 domain-containing protein [Akkermansiaceae bacterium]